MFLYIGENTLGTKMQAISREAHTSKVYTNHCLRATTIQALDSEGFAARHIMSVSGYKSDTSIKHYAYARVELGCVYAQLFGAKISVFKRD